MKTDFVLAVTPNELKKNIAPNINTNAMPPNSL